MKNKPCKHTYCKHNTASNKNLKRYGNKCLKNGQCSVIDIATHQNVINVLDLPVWMGNQYIPQLTDDELDYCINNETRKSGQAKLRAHKKSRNNKEDTP